MANETPTPAPATPADAAPAADAAKDAAKLARKRARKELNRTHVAPRDPKHPRYEAALDPGHPSFDHARYHELHYLAAGKPVPETDPDFLD